MHSHLFNLFARTSISRKGKDFRRAYFYTHGRSVSPTRRESEPRWTTRSPRTWACTVREYNVAQRRACEQPLIFTARVRCVQPGTPPRIRESVRRVVHALLKYNDARVFRARPFLSSSLCVFAREDARQPRDVKYFRGEYKGLRWETSRAMERSLARFVRRHVSEEKRRRKKQRARVSLARAMNNYPIPSMASRVFEIYQFVEWRWCRVAMLINIETNPPRKFIRAK